MKKQVGFTRILSSLLVVFLLFVEGFSFSVVAKGEVQEEVQEEAIMYPFNCTYMSDYAAQSYIKVKICRNSAKEKFLIFFPRTRYTYSVCLELFEDKEQTKVIAQYHSKELKSWSDKETFEEIISHDEKLKNKKVYDTLVEIHSLEMIINQLQPVYNNGVELQQFLVTETLKSLGDEAQDAFFGVLNESIDDFLGDIKSEVFSSFVETGVKCLKEIDDIKNGPVKEGFWERLFNFIASAYTSDDKPDVPETERGTILAEAMAESGISIVRQMTTILDIAIYNDIYLKQYNKLYEDSQTAVAEKRNSLCEIIKDLDSGN